MSASGRIGDGITYQRHNIGHNVHARMFRKKQEHAKQLVVRKWFKKGYYVWRNNVTGFGYYISSYCTGLIDSQKDKWKRNAVLKRMTGINYFMQGWVSRSLKSLAQYQLPPKTGFCLCGEWTAGNLVTGGKFIMGG